MIVGLPMKPDRRCPYCAEVIRPEAKVCPHCTRDLREPSKAEEFAIALVFCIGALAIVGALVIAGNWLLNYPF